MSESRVIFHKLLYPEDAVRLVVEHFNIHVLDAEEVPLENAVGRVLAEDVVALVDVPPFDRATMDGYAVRSLDLMNASEVSPVELKVIGRVEAGEWPQVEVSEGTCVEIATGAPLPAGADAVVMVEYTKQIDDRVLVYRQVAPGENVAHAGSDIAKGEIFLRKCTYLTAREIGLLAACGYRKVKVIRRPRVAVISTGNELQEPGSALPLGKVYDVNSYMLHAACLELGCESTILARVPDDERQLEEAILQALEKKFDIVLISGGTSAGISDITYRVLDRLGKLLLHGLLVRPGKPTVVADVNGVPVIGLPGYPNSALMIFRLLVEPIIRKMLCLSEEECTVEAVLTSRVFSARGRRALVPVMLVKRGDTVLAFPLTAPSGSLSPLANADGILEVPENVDFLDAGQRVKIRLLGKEKSADLVVIGSHDIMLDRLLSELNELGIRIRQINVGSLSGIRAVMSNVADVAGTHLIDEETLQYNIPILEKLQVRNAVLVRGYLREQGIIVQKGNPKNIKSIEDFLRPDVIIVNRNKGAGTRALLDLHLKKLAEKLGKSFEEITRSIKGYTNEVKTHTAVAAAVAQGRADAGLGIRIAAELYNLDFIPIGWEEYDLLIRVDSLDTRPVKLLLEKLRSPEFKERLDRTPGYRSLPDTGQIIWMPGKS